MTNFKNKNYEEHQPYLAKFLMFLRIVCMMLFTFAPRENWLKIESTTVQIEK